MPSVAKALAQNGGLQLKLSPSEVVEELQRVEGNKYRQFLKRLTLRNVRGFVDETVEFKFPVTALIGTNGGGKSTILGAAAMAYRDTKPAKFFPKAFVGDESMSNWMIEYELVDKTISIDRLPQRTARFAQAKWRRTEFPARQVVYIEIQRTVPVGELTEFRRFISGDRAKYDIIALSDNTVKYAGAVLDKDIRHYRVVKNRDLPTEKMYLGAIGDAVGYSQFHFGAGEASVIETIDRIEAAADNSLILIEEVENGLHPVAVRLFVRYLQSAARRKRLQIVFTTHSQDAVDELPSKAIWASINKRVWNGNLSIESLRAITGETPDQGAIFVEDDMAKEWVSNAINRYAPDISATTRIFPAGGYPSCVKVSQYHNENPITGVRVPSVALVDGDIYDPSVNGQLPPHAKFLREGVPETVVFDYIFQNRERLSAVIRQRCLLSQFDEYRIASAIEGARNSACDPHQVFSEMGQRLNFASAIQIRSGLIDIYNEENPDTWTECIDFIRQRTRSSA